MRFRAVAPLLMLLTVCGCTTAPTKTPDLLSSDPHVALMCDGVHTTFGQVGTRKVKEQALIYPSTDPKLIEIAFTGQFHMRPLCVGDTVCKVDRSEGRMSITIKPSSAVRSDPGYSESLTFEQSTGRLQFGAGGTDGWWEFVGKCQLKEGLR